MLAAEKSKDTFMAPIGIGLALFVVEIAGVAYTGASVNPARSFGPCVAAASFEGYHWIYWVGPFLGSLISAGFYHFIKFFNYQEANPGQDSTGNDEAPGADEGSEKQSNGDLENGDGARRRQQQQEGGNGQYGSGEYHPGYGIAARDQAEPPRF